MPYKVFNGSLFDESTQLIDIDTNIVVGDNVTIKGTNTTWLGKDPGDNVSLGIQGKSFAAGITKPFHIGDTVYYVLTGSNFSNLSDSQDYSRNVVESVQKDGTNWVISGHFEITDFTTMFSWGGYVNNKLPSPYTLQLSTSPIPIPTVAPPTDGTQGGNNTPTSGSAAPIPDLTIHADRWSSNVSVQSGSTISFTTTISATGSGSSVPAQIGYYLSNDPVISTSDKLIAMDTYAYGVSSLATHSSTIPVQLPSGLANGIYYLGAIIDVNNYVADANETNNASNPIAITIGSGTGPSFGGTTIAQASFGEVTYDPYGVGGKVYALYHGLLGRAPDAIGLETFTAAINNGTSLRDITTAILASPEARQHVNATDNASFVEQLYGTVLNRHSDAGGLASWTAQLNNGASRADVTDSFVFSSEHVAKVQTALQTGIFVPDSHAADVARLYYGLLDRAPDATGLQSFTGAVENSGSSLHDVASVFLGSSEYRAASTGYSDAQFVDALYQQVLGRAGDSYGVGAWNGYLAQGGTRGAVVDGFTSSAEFQGKYAGLSNAGYVEQVYEHVLGRAGDPGAAYWTHALDSGQLSRAQVAHGFTSSAEFQTKYVAPSDASFVDSLYENALGRHADAGGLQLWTNALAHGASRADVALGIAQSGEAHQHLLGQIEQGWHLA